MKEDDFEKVVIKALFSNEMVRNKVLPSLREEWFGYDIENKLIVRKILDYNTKYSAMPNVLETKRMLTEESTIKAFDEVLSIPDEEVNTKFILNEIEEFVRKKLVYNISEEMHDYCRGAEVTGSFADKISDAETFTFDTNIGLSFFEDPAVIYEDIIANEKVISSGLKAIDGLIGGGFHEKSLNMILAGCVTKDTKVNIRYTKNIYGCDYLYTTTEIEKIKELLKHEYIIEVSGPEGYTKVLRYVEKGPKQVFDVNCNGHKVTASYDHLFETEEGWVMTKDLDVSKHKILCDDGLYHTFNINDIADVKDVVDIEVENEKHRYFTNGLSSHNTNIGKTLCLCSFTTNMILTGKNVLYVTFEDSEKKIGQRIAQNLYDVTQDQLKGMTRDSYANCFKKALTQVGHNRLVIKEYSEGSLNALALKSLIKELKDKKNFIPDALVIDYIGCMIPNGRISINTNDNTRLQLVSGQVRSVGMELGIPVISAMQANRGGYQSSDLGLDDVADSFGQTMKADAVFAIMQDDNLKEAQMYAIKLLKTRYGNMRGHTVTIGVDVEKQRIYDLKNYDSEATPSEYIATTSNNEIKSVINDFI